MSRTWFELLNDYTVAVYYQIEDVVVQRGVLFTTPRESERRTPLMGREIRRVPVDFQHPIQWREQRKRELFGEVVTRWTYCLAPMWDYSLLEAQRRWAEEIEKYHRDRTGEKRWTEQDRDSWLARLERERCEPTPGDEIVVGELIWPTAEDYCGERPSEDDGAQYQPEDWPPEVERGYVVYETVSEGTPITPCFATPKELIDWLVEKGTAWDDPMPRERAERFVGAGGSIPSIIVSDGVMRSGMEVADLLGADRG